MLFFKLNNNNKISKWKIGFPYMEEMKGAILKRLVDFVYIYKYVVHFA